MKSVRAKLKDQPPRDELGALVPAIKWKAPRTHTLSQDLIKVRSSWAADSIENNEQREYVSLPATVWGSPNVQTVCLHVVLEVQESVH